jgi:hypothetical protein
MENQQARPVMVQIDKWDATKLLFQVHHGQLAEKRQKIHSITERTCAILVVITGWILGTSPPTTPLRVCVICGVLALATGATIVQLRNNSTYMHIAAVIQQLNHVLGVFDVGTYIEDDTIYPSHWKMFGLSNHFKSIVHHLFSIWALAIICVTAAILR